LSGELIGGGMGREEWNIGGGFGMGWREQALKERDKVI
jgi:hypothetical protein